MDRGPGEPYEVLDFGRGPLPTAGVGDSAEPPTGRDWRRITSMVVAFAVGIAAGAYAWDAWRDRQQAATEADTALLVGGVTVAQPTVDGKVAFTVVVENLGGAPVRVQELRVRGWERSPDRDPLGAEIPSNGRRSIADEGIVDCSVPLPSQVDARVLTANGVSREVEIRLVPRLDSPFDWVRSSICSPPQGEYVAYPDIVLEAGPDFIRTAILIENYTNRTLRVTGLSTSNAAYRVEPLGLPWTVAAGGGTSGPGQATAQVIWRVANCRAAAQALTSDFTLSLVVSGEQQQTGHGGWNDTPAVAELIRLGVRACEKS